MKNLFKSLVASAALLFASSVSAGTLYWQVQPDDNVSAFDEAWLIAENTSTGVKKELAIVKSQSDKQSTALTQTELDGYESDAYLFYVEMCNYTNGTAPDYVVSTGYKYGYGDLVSQGYVATGAIDANSAAAAAAAGNMGSAVPEPSSGLLLLMGGALLALRRRRQK